MNRVTVAVPLKAYDKIKNLRDKMREEKDRPVTIAEAIEQLIKLHEEVGSRD